MTKLTELSTATDDPYIKKHALSIMQVIDIQTYFPNHALLEELDAAIIEKNFGSIESFTDGSLPFIISWKSKHDEAVSFAWVTLPENWDKTKTYPVYIDLHGYWDVAANRISFLTFPYMKSTKPTRIYKNGFQVSPWGRGNLWYQGIAEKDIFECIEEVSKVFNIDMNEKFIVGHSMGGYGAWHLATKYPKQWKALAVHAGAVDYYQSQESPLTKEAVLKIKEKPVYIICGDQDSFLESNKKLYALLEETGNIDHEFHTFKGGHIYKQETVEAIYAWFEKLK